MNGGAHVAESVDIRPYITWVCLLLVIGSKALATASVEEELKNISYEDRFFMREFFRSFFLHDLMGHVIFFDTKPVCFTSLATSHNRHFFEDLYAKGWRAWKKHQHRFSHPRFLFAQYEHYSRDGEKMLNIFLINKKALMRCFKQHIARFQAVLGDDFSAESCLQEIELTQQFPKAIYQDDCLLGLTLGYGPESSATFAQKNLYSASDTSYPAHTKHYCSVNITIPDKCPIFPIGFMCDPDSREVQWLKQCYEFELQELWKQYKQSRSTLKLVLEGLCSKN